MNHSIKNLVGAVLILCLAYGLVACGKKMQLTPPDGSSYPRQYPKPE